MSHTWTGRGEDPVGSFPELYWWYREPQASGHSQLCPLPFVEPFHWLPAAAEAALRLQDTLGSVPTPTSRLENIVVSRQERIQLTNTRQLLESETNETKKGPCSCHLVHQSVQFGSEDVKVRGGTIRRHPIIHLLQTVRVVTCSCQTIQAGGQSRGEWDRKSSLNVPETSI